MTQKMIKTVRRASKVWQSIQPVRIVKSHRLQQQAKPLAQVEEVRVPASLAWLIKGAMALLLKEVTEIKKVSPLHEIFPVAIKLVALATCQNLERFKK